MLVHGLAMVVELRVLMRLAVLWLVMIRPQPIVVGWRRRDLLLSMLDNLAWRIEPDGKGMRFDDQLCLNLNIIFRVVDIFA